MEHGARRLRVRIGLKGWAMAAALPGGFAGHAVAAAPAASAVHATTFAAAGGGEFDLGIRLLVCGVLLIAALGFAWLIYLMATCPPEEQDMGGYAPTAAEQREMEALSPGMAALLQLLPGAGTAATAGLQPGLGRLLRSWIGGRLGHPGPM